ncbi:hypothetical protein GW17_00041226 [Ensete ventricosum]|nr:hypothetical protein GW17_00041226 [Ensete ventricosum]RZS12662.1 hypothetical protein BHM03_00044141 [Ensete ventricosum]
MARYTSLLSGEGSVLRRCRLLRPRHLARFALRGLAELDQSQGVRQRHAPAARSPGWRDNPVCPSRAGCHIAPSSIMASPE